MFISNLLIPGILQRIRSLNLYSEDDIDMMRYSLQAFLWETEKIIILLLVFALVGYQDFFLVTLAALITIRVNAGGYHSDTPVKCLLITFFIFFLAIIVLPQIPLNNLGVLMVAGFSLLATLMAAPVVSLERRAIIKTKTSTSKIISFVITVIWLALAIFMFQTYSHPVLWIIFLQNVQLLMEYFRRKEADKRVTR